MKLFNQLKTKADRLLARYEHAKSSIRSEKGTLARAKDHVSCIEKAQEIVQAIAQKVQQEAHKQIASVVSRCLEAVFEENACQFRIHFERKRGKTEARLVFVQGDNEIDPETAAGCGQIDVAAFALRLACLMLHRPPLRRLIVADEPFRFINGEKYQERARELLLTLSEEMGVQFILVSDDSWLRVGTVIEVD